MHPDRAAVRARVRHRQADHVSGCFHAGKQGGASFSKAARLHFQEETEQNRDHVFQRKDQLGERLVPHSCRWSLNESIRGMRTSLDEPAV